MAAPNASSEGHHVILSPYRFDANELRWLPTGEAAAKVRMSKEARDGPGRPGTARASQVQRHKVVPTKRTQKDQNGPDYIS